MSDTWGSGSFEPIKNEPKISLKAFFFSLSKRKESMRKHSAANHDHNVNKLGYEMEVYIVIHDDAWGLIASNRRVLDQMKLVQKLTAVPRREHI